MNLSKYEHAERKEAEADVYKRQPQRYAQLITFLKSIIAGR